MKLVLALLALGACGPRVDPQGPGALPEVTETAPPAEGATKIPARSPPPPPVEATPAPAPPPEDKPPPQAQLELTPSKGSTVKATLSLVQLDDETHIVGTATGLAKKATYMLSKRESCAAFKPDDDSRRSAPVIYSIALTSDATGTAKIDDTAKAVHLDGPLSVVGAFFVISKTVGGKELACGRVL